MAMTLLENVTLQDIKSGRNWRIVDNDGPMQGWHLYGCDSFAVTDCVAYSALVLCSNDVALPTILVKEVGESEWWGDSISWFKGKWIEPGPNAQMPRSIAAYVTNPLSNDPSFSHGLDVECREGFAKWKHLLPE